jgi:hypothetical protein
LLLLGALGALANAATPLTEVQFGPAYADVDLAAALLEDGLVAALRSDLRFDKKLALASAFPSGREGAAEALVRAIAAERREPVESLRLEQVGAEDRALIAYLRGREDEDDLSAIRYGASGILGVDPLGLARTAARERPDDFAVVAIEALLSTADPTVGRGCDGWALWERTLRKHPEAGRNLRPPAVDAITQAIRSRCPRPAPSHGTAP